MADVGKVNTKALDDIGKINLMTVPAGGITYADYEYEADLASGASYTPPVSTFFVFFTETLAAIDVNLKWYNAQDSVWAESTFVPEEKFMFHQSASQHLRIINDDGVNTLAIGLYGATWTGYTDYEHEADLASGATYTPPAKAFFTVFAECTYAGQDCVSCSRTNVEWYDAQNAVWVCRVGGSDERTLLHQSTSQHLRIINNDGNTRALGVYGATWT